VRNPFKKKKANRFRGYNPTKEELKEEFDKLLQYRVGQRMKLELGDTKDMAAFFKYRIENGDRIQAEEKEKLLKEMEGKGYSRAVELTKQPNDNILFKKIIGGKNENAE
jgi:hypothetical protein